jgi:hypothetical protein
MLDDRTAAIFKVKEQLLHETLEWYSVVRNSNCLNDQQLLRARSQSNYNTGSDSLLHLSYTITTIYIWGTELFPMKKKLPVLTQIKQFLLLWTPPTGPYLEAAQQFHIFKLFIKFYLSATFTSTSLLQVSLHMRLMNKILN